jgi:3,4-dihydroxy 2-butanone 4-phosphate synthase/GTP cyclohydrolase II
VFDTAEVHAPANDAQCPEGVGLILVAWGSARSSFNEYGTAFLVAPNVIMTSAHLLPEDLRQPGHIFPVMAQPGGVLTRAGHTEAGCDLARLAGLDASSVIVEIMNDDGTMARRPDLESFAARHNLKIGTIADLIRHRLRQERSVERIAEQQVETEFGAFRLLAYEDHVHREVHLALVRGSIETTHSPLVRVHPIDTLSDLVGVQGVGRTWTLRDAMKRIAEVGTGIVIVLRDHTTPRELADAVAALGSRPENAASAQVAPQVLRTYGIGAQILKDLGVTRMQVLSTPKQLQGLSAFGLEITGYVAE